MGVNTELYAILDILWGNIMSFAEQFLKMRYYKETISCTQHAPMHFE